MKIKSNLLVIAAGLLCLLLDNIFDIGNNNLYQANLLPLIPIAGSLVSGLVSGLFGSSSANATNRMNMEMFNRNLEFQNKWNSKQLAFTNKMFHQANDFSAEQADLARQHDFDLFDVESQWNSYPNQRRLMEEAGLNPAMMFAGGNTLGNVSAPNSGAVAHASAPSANVSGSGSSIPTLHQSSSASAEMIKAVSGAIKDVSSVVSENVKLDPEVKQLKENVNLMQSQQEVNSAVAAKTASEDQYTKTLNLIAEAQAKYADQKEFASLNKICNESQELIARAYLAGVQGEVELSKKLYNDAQTELLKLQGTQLEKSLPILINNLKKQGDLLDAQTYAAKRGADAQYQNAIASMIAAQAQNYLAHNPQTFEKWFVESMNSLGLSPEDLPVIAKKVEKLVNDNTPKALLKRAGTYVRDGIANFLFGVPGYDVRNQAQKQVQKYIDKR